MHIPLGIALLALLALVLLPLLDRSANSESHARDPRAHLVRIARWVNK